MAGRPRVIAPDEPTVKVVADVPVSLARALRAEAAEAGVSVAELIRRRLGPARSEVAA